MKQIETKKSPKIPKYICEYCDYITNNKKDFKKHSLTSKHQSESNMKQNETENPQKSPKIPKLECNCGYMCNSRTTLWRHKKICKAENGNIIINNPLDKDLILMLMSKNDELQTMMMEVIKNGTNNITTTNSHNKSFNLQFFLNETCKDAMNIMDFIDSIKLQLSDLENVGEMGYIEGISNIIVKNLKNLDVTQRPVHCTDKKRETIYIKNDDKWEKDEERNMLRKMIKKIADKNTRLLPKFKEAHPDCNMYHSKFSNQFNKIIVESMGGSGDNDFEKEEKIIKKITKEVILHKD